MMMVMTMIVVYIIWRKKNGNDINKTILNNNLK